MQQTLLMLTELLRVKNYQLRKSLNFCKFQSYYARFKKIYSATPENIEELVESAMEAVYDDCRPYANWLRGVKRKV